MNLVIVQARMGSSRLPGKVLKEVCGRTLLELQYERIQQAARTDRIMIATTSEVMDDPIEWLCQSRNIECFRGSENDVLDRFCRAARAAGCASGDAVIRITADCPLLDYQVLDELIELFRDSGADYASNINPPTYPDGLDAEIFTYAALERAWQEASLTSEREHVTPYLRNHPEIFSQANLQHDTDLSYLRWTVDEPQDLEMIRIIYEKLYPVNKYFVMADVLKLIEENPDLLEINKGLERNEGYARSLLADQVIGKE
jgi:spore coat polysaccharide biosynthesis protein SpsF